jgi:hypothetical protein|tara:strand:- start:14 stop:751 length:738 start_codon:yes stop_codon:yes gene_type:complete
MALINRQTLKNYFKKGGFATEKHFVDLIDSSLNVVDDGISIQREHGLKISPIGFSTKLISFFKKSTQKSSEFSLELDQDNAPGLSVQGENDKSIIKVKKEGLVGINTLDPKYAFDVNGTVGMRSRVGTHAIGSVPGDGSWHSILSNLDGVNGYEVTANIKGKLGSGRYSIAHAIALSTFGGRSSRNKIKTTVASYGSFFYKISFRWYGDVHNYELQAKTSRHFGIDEKTGSPFPISFNIVKLFSD